MKSTYRRFFRILAFMAVLCIVIISFTSCGDNETDEYKLISEAFSEFIGNADSYEFSELEKCVAEDGTEYYYFKIKLIDDFSKKYGMEETGGIIKYDGKNSYEFEHMHMFKYEENLMLEEFRKVQESGNSHELSSDEIKILCERIDALRHINTNTVAY